MKTCVFVVDVQNGFINPSTAHVVDRIHSLLEMDLFDHVIFTRFKNRQDSPYIKHLKWNDFFSENEIQIVDSLRPFAGRIVDKYSYSGITSGIVEFIKAEHIQTAFVCGIDTDCCVLATALDLFEANIHPAVLAYYSASTGGKSSHEAALTVLARLIGASNIIEGVVNAEIINRFPAR